MSFSRVVMRLILLGTILLSANVIAAESIRYVNDHLIITLRAGQGSEFKILKSLPTGTRLELLEESEGTDFSRVRTADGIEGWVRSWYLSKTPTANLLLAEATEKAERLVSNNKKLLIDNSESEKSIIDLKNKLAKFEEENARLLKENNKLKDIAGRPIELESENRRLTTELAKMQDENQRLGSENSVLNQSSVQKWFLAGAGVLVLGVIAGLILPHTRRSRGSGWS